MTTYQAKHCLQDNGNSVFDDTVSVLELSCVSCDLDLSIDDVPNSDIFDDTVITYISGFIMHTIIKKEKCTFCYTFLKESKICPLFNTKQLGEGGGADIPYTRYCLDCEFCKQACETS